MFAAIGNLFSGAAQGLGQAVGGVADFAGSAVGGVGDFVFGSGEPVTTNLPSSDFNQMAGKADAWLDEVPIGNSEINVASMPAQQSTFGKVAGAFAQPWIGSADPEEQLTSFIGNVSGNLKDRFMEDMGISQTTEQQPDGSTIVHYSPKQAQEPGSVPVSKIPTWLLYGGGNQAPQQGTREPVQWSGGHNTVMIIGAIGIILYLLTAVDKK